MWKFRRNFRNLCMSVGVMAGLLAQTASHAAGSPEQIQAAMTALSTSLATVTNSPAYAQIQQIRQTVSTYQWRTVYQLTMVNKTPPAPGQRLGITAVPNASQLDAENYLVGLPFPQGNPIPGLNCPVASMGGPAGRPVTVTVPGSNNQVTLSDTQIRDLMVRASPAAGQNAYNAFAALRNNVCSSIYTYAQFHFRTQRYNEFQSNWQECASNGIAITQWSRKEGFNLPGNHHRSAAVGGGLIFKCGKVYSGNADDAMDYETWFKWSDDNPVPLNILKTLRESGGSSNSCPQTCIPVNGFASICVGLDPGISAITDTLPLRLGAKFSRYDTNRTFCTPIINVPAPFGVGQSLAEMADSGKQQLAQQLQNQLLSLLPVSNSTVTQLKTLLALVM